MAYNNQFKSEYTSAIEPLSKNQEFLQPWGGEDRVLASFEISSTSEPKPGDAVGSKYHHSSGIFFQFNVSPTSFDLDPYFFFADGDRIKDPRLVNDFSCVVNNGPTTSKDINLKKRTDEQGNFLPYPTSFRPAVTRGPLILSGWGYDIAGLPVPKERGGVDKNGAIVPPNEVNEDSRNFDYYTPIERRRWKTGPVDLRWDDERKVWTGGAEFIEGIMSTTLPPGDLESPSIGSGQIVRGEDWKFQTYTLDQNLTASIKPEPFGEPVSSDFLDGKPSKELKEIVRIYNRNSNLSLAAGDYFAATKINYEWRIVGAGGGGSCVVGRFKRVNCTGDVTKTTIPTPKFYIENNKLYMDFGTLKDKFVYFLKLDNFLDLIPTEAAGADLVPSDGKQEIPKPKEGFAYFISLVAFENCKYSSDVVTLKIYPDFSFEKYYERALEKLFDCPNSNDCFGTVVDDISGTTVFATHPFKFIKHDVRVVACKSNLTIKCQDNTYPAYVVTEIDDCANAGTGESRE